MNVVALRFYVRVVGRGLPDARVTRVSSLSTRLNSSKQLEAAPVTSFAPLNDHYIFLSL